MSQNNVPSGILRFRVFGEPHPAPKKDVVMNPRTGRLMPISHDYRERTNKFTGKKERYDKGYKNAWLKQVRKQVYNQMIEQRLHPYPKNHPIAVGLLFFITKAKSCKLAYPSQDPDLDNLEYAVMNALKRTVKGSEKSALAGHYPDGVLFYEDNQSVWRIPPGGMLWATNANSPGLEITVCSMETQYAVNQVMNSIIDARQERLSLGTN